MIRSTRRRRRRTRATAVLVAAVASAMMMSFLPMRGAAAAASSDANANTVEAFQQQVDGGEAVLRNSNSTTTNCTLFVFVPFTNKYVLYCASTVRCGDDMLVLL